MLAERGIDALLVLRIVALLVILFLVLAGLFTALYLLSVLATRRAARRMGTAVVPVAIRLLSHSGSLPRELEQKVALLRDAGYMEVGQFATDRAPRATIVGFVASDGSHSAVAAQHPTLGTYIELARTDAEGGSVSVADVRLPAVKRPAWMRVISRPGASVAQLQAALASHPSLATPVVHDAGSFVKRFESSYRRAMVWAYTEGPMKSVDPEAVAKLSGVPADAETTYFLKMQREEKGS